MRTLFIFLFFLLISHSASSQNITLKFKYVPIDTVLKEIKKQCGLDYQWMPRQKPDSVSVLVLEQSLPEALAILLDGTAYSFQVYTRYFAIVDRLPGTGIAENKANISDQGSYVPGPPPADVTGTVVDEAGQPIAGADIQVMQSNIITRADANGKFTLRKVRVEAGYEFSHPGYESQRYFNIGFTELKPVVLKKK